MVVTVTPDGNSFGPEGRDALAALVGSDVALDGIDDGVLGHGVAGNVPYARIAREVACDEPHAVERALMEARQPRATDAALFRELRERASFQVVAADEFAFVRGDLIERREDMMEGLSPEAIVCRIARQCDALPVVEQILGELAIDDSQNGGRLGEGCALIGGRVVVRGDGPHVGAGQAGQGGESIDQGASHARRRPQFKGDTALCIEAFCGFDKRQHANLHQVFAAHTGTNATTKLAAHAFDHGQGARDQIL